MILTDPKAAVRAADAKRYSSTYATKRVTASGQLLDYLNPRPEDIRITDIAEALAKQCRFSGHTIKFYSVAQHSCMVHDLCPLEARPWALLHDAHEAYIGDIPTPLQTALHALGGGIALGVITQRLDRAIAKAFGLALPDEPTRLEVRHWDRVALNTERYVLLDQRAAHHNIWAKDLPHPNISALKSSWSWDRAVEQFLQRFDALNLSVT